MVDKNTVKNWFKTGLKPTQTQFWAFFDSIWFKDEKIPITAIDQIDAILAAKAEAEVLTYHLTDAAAHAAEFLAKEDKNKKGAANGYAPLDEFTKISINYLNVVNDLISGGATSLLTAEMGKVLQTQITSINTLLTSDNLNLDTVQEIVDAIETVQTSLSTILVNDLTTGGVTKALTAEMGKSLKALIDGLNTLPDITDIDNKVGINNEVPEFALDVKEAPSSEIVLTGTVSFNGFMINGSNTLFLSELMRGSEIKVISTGETLVVDHVMSDTQAYCMMGGNQFNNEEVSTISHKPNIANFSDILKVLKNFGNPLDSVIEINGRILNKNGIVENQTDNFNVWANNYGPDGGQMGGGFSFPRGDPKFSWSVSKDYNDGKYWWKIADSSGSHQLGFSQNGDIIIKGLPSSPSVPNQLYKDSNGFLKIG